MATVEDGHVVTLGHAVDGGEEGEEVALGVDVLLTVGGKQNVTAFLQSQSLVDVAGLDVGKVFVQHLSHG